MPEENLRPVELSQYSALVQVGDEVMSMLHAHSLRQEVIPSATVINWLQGIYDLVEVGLGRPPHFANIKVQDTKSKQPAT